MTCVFLMGSIHLVMKAEKLLKGHGLQMDLIPVPREISSDCGVAVELASESREEALRLMAHHKIPFVDCYARGEDGRLEKWG